MYIAFVAVSTRYITQTSYEIAFLKYTNKHFRLDVLSRQQRLRRRERESYFEGQTHYSHL